MNEAVAEPMWDEVCLRCSEPSSYQYVVRGDNGSVGYICPPCCALVDPDRFLIGANRAALEHALAAAQRSDEEWEAMGWRMPATVSDLHPAKDPAEGAEQI